MRNKTGIRSSHGGIKGTVNQLLAKNIDRILAIPGSKLKRNYVKATQDVAATQMAVLKEILTYSQSSHIGKKYNFKNIDSHKQYYDNVPVMDYEDHRPYVERHTKGEENVLFPGKPIMYTRTSGTTAKPKLIPITSYNFQRTIKNRGKLWLYQLSKNFPGIFSGKDFTLVSPAEEGRTPDGVPFGSLSGLMYKNIPEFMKLVHTIPYEVICISDFNAKAYSLLRFGIPSNVTSIFTGNPSTVLNLAKKADLWKEQLIRDIHDGTLSTEYSLETHIREKIKAQLIPAPQRAKELEIIANGNNHFKPTQYWPNLKLIHTWTNGNCRLVLPKLKEWFHEDTPILDFGYIASEITATDLVDPKTNGSLLAIKSGFYEFSRFEEGENPQTFLLAHQLEVGQKYYIYVTTYSGLYRYDMNDVVEVVGHFNQAPILKFLFKGKGITNICGEKLSETQLIEAVYSTSETTCIDHDFFVAYADTEHSQYQLYIEFLSSASPSQIDEFARTLDRILRQVNIEYDAKRHSHRLQPIKIIPLAKDAFSRYRKLRLNEGALEGQLKWLHLSGTKATKDRMERLSAPPAEVTSH